MAIVNGGTIPDRGLFGVFLVGADRARARRRARRGDGLREPRPAKPSFSGAAPGASKRSRTIACSCRPLPASPARCRSGTATRPGRPREFGASHRRDDARAARAAARRRLRAADGGHSLDPAPPRICCATSTTRPPPPARPRRPDDRRSSAAATSSATGASASSPRSAAASTRRGAWRSSARSATEARHGSRDDVDRRWLRRAVPGDRSAAGRRSLLLPSADELKHLVVRQLGGQRALRCQVPRGRRRARCCCRGAAPVCARRSGSSASAPPICWRSRRVSARSRCCSRRIASAFATSSTCRRSSTCCVRSSARSIRVVTVDSQKPSPFASSLLFGYVANYHLRRRRAARRAPRAGALHRPGAAARDARRGRAS